MKIRIADRILVALAGLILLLLAVILLDQTLLPMGVTAWLQQLATPVSTQPSHALYITAVIACVAVLALLGLYCLGMLFRHQKKSKRGFVMQQTECGELSISVRAIEGLVQKCVDRHEEIHVMSTSLDTTRDGLVIRLRIGLAGGVNIPLAVAALQKQIKQYVTSCSGVDVKEVKVQVETSSKGKDSPYTVADLPGKAEPLPVVEDAAPVMTAAICEEAAEEPRRPLHQRLFRRAEEPAIMPQPPESAPVEEPAPAVEPVPDAEPEQPAEPEQLPEESVTAAPETEPEAVKEETHEVAE